MGNFRSCFLPVYAMVTRAKGIYTRSMEGSFHGFFNVNMVALVIAFLVKFLFPFILGN